MPSTNVSIPSLYRFFFLYIEPISAILGSCYAGARPGDYVADLTMSSKAFLGNNNPTSLSTQMTMTVYQLSNLYLLFALNEYLVLSSTSSLKTWRRVLLCLLIADFGHLATMYPLGLDVFWKVGQWNAMVWGSVAFVYMGATMRMMFLAEVGFGGSAQLSTNKKKD